MVKSRSAEKNLFQAPRLFLSWMLVSYVSSFLRTSVLQRLLLPFQISLSPHSSLFYPSIHLCRGWVRRREKRWKSFHHSHTSTHRSSNVVSNGRVLNCGFFLNSEIYMFHFLMTFYWKRKKYCGFKFPKLEQFINIKLASLNLSLSL